MPDPTPDRCPHIHRDLTGRCFDCGYVDAEHRASHLAEQAEHAARDRRAPIPPDPAPSATRAIAELLTCTYLDTLPAADENDRRRALAADARREIDELRVRALAAEAAIESRAAALVAERLRAAPGVEDAISDANVAWWDEALRQCSPGGRAVIQETDDRAAKNSALSAAIVRAIADAREQGRREAIEQAPEVEGAIGVIADNASHDCTCRKEEMDTDHSNGYRGAPGEPEDCDCRVSRHLDTLRAAIAADKARAVKAARPTPDEARRLVEAYDRATRNSYVTGGPEALRTARTALLRALGVEP